MLCLSNLGIASFYHYSKAYPQDVLIQNFGWLPVAFVVLLFVSHSVGYLPISHLLFAELYPTDIRTVATGLTNALIMGMGSLVVKLFPTLTETLGIGNMFFLFAGSSFLMAVWGAFFIPENQGLSLAKVEEKYNPKNTS